MKVFLTCLILTITLTSFSQNIKKVIDNNDLEGFKKYLDKHEEIYEEIHFHKEDYSVHPMVYASGKDRLDMVKLFVKNKSKIDDYHTVMSVSFAISLSTENNELIEYLYKEEPNLNEICEACHGHNAIMIATVYGNEDWYFKLRKKSEMTIISNDGNNLYHLAADPIRFSNPIFNDIKSIYELDINKVNQFGRTPLQYAAKFGNDTVFNTFLNSGATYNKLNNLYVDAIYGGNISIYNYVDSVYDTKPIWGFYDAVDEEDFNTYHPLELAILYNSTAIAKQILSEMLDDIEKTKNNAHIDLIVDLLNSRTMEDDVFLPLWETIQWDNKELFQFLVENMVRLNKMELQYTAYNDQIDEEYTELAEVVFTKFEYRAAKRKFGEDYIESLYEHIEF